MRLVFIVVMILCAGAALWFFPYQDRTAKRRLILLNLLLLPLALAIGSGPLVIDHHGLSPNSRLWLIEAQQMLLASYPLILAGLLPFLRGGRVFAVAIGIAMIFIGFLVAAVSIVILDPGSW